MTAVPASIRRALGFFLLVCAFATPPAFPGAEATEGSGPYDRASGPELNPETLTGILEEFAPLGQESLTVLDRLILWLEEIFSASSDRPLPDWVDDFRIPDEVARAIFYGACALIVLLAVGILVNELRLVRRHTATTSSSRRTAALSPWKETLPALDELPLAERPARLLEMIADRLIGAGRTTSALTHREIRDAAALLDAPPAGFIELAGVAERLRYAPVPPDDVEIAKAVRSAREILTEGTAG